jgi:hypothetical protein
MNYVNSLIETSLSSLGDGKDASKKKSAKRRCMRDKFKDCVKESLFIKVVGDRKFQVNSGTISDKFYTIYQKYMDDKIIYECDCGHQFGVGKRTNCKHILAIILSQLKSFVDGGKDLVIEIDSSELDKILMNLSF